MQNMTHRGPLITKNYICGNQKINFQDQNFLSEIEINKISLKLENGIG